MKLLKLVPDDTNFAFLKWRNIAMAFSILTIIASIALVGARGLNFGVDFIGGQMIQATFTQSETAPISELRDSIGGLGYGEATIQRFGQPNEISIRMRLPAEAESRPEAANEMTAKIVELLKSTHSDVRIDGVESVSGKVSSELFEKGAFSLLAAIIAISIYIWVRFEWQFGVGALFALVHDVALTFGLFALTQMEFNLNIVAALLTIIGYSLNDTIVVFDRIRENLKKYRKMDIIALLDLSVNETLARTVMTSLTMLIALAGLIFFGPDVIFGFAVAMFFGVFVGTYSSVYMAAPILIWLKVGPDTFVPSDSGNDKAEQVGGPEQVG
ncbi:protein translocase subunit SecF [Parasphingorhabdus halotolerans]|uniref:Protein-export membrane protein SecF n=1 Tax=Parasphingorhabdus halotolerans TaxID=2725558 RepID=A0A6H2DQ99_9SPHN|nr:protein translocase subunit SecF [Parasphingorhabdus halotolerans]QJB70514.1 protein translocase subunit SecF [Parasphingorhabdus halotolerans]